MRLGQKKNKLKKPCEKKVGGCINSPNKSFFKYFWTNEPGKRGQAHVKRVLKERGKTKVNF